MTIENSAGLIELAFTYAIALGIGIWQVVKMRRELARDRAAARKDAKEGNETKILSK